MCKYAFRSFKNPDYKKHLKERFCFGFPQFGQNVRPIHIHLVSVGEANASQILICKLAITYPEKPILITVTTPTGRSRATSLFSSLPQVTIRYLPFDIPVLMERFLSKVSPQISIMLETELWPYFLLFAKRKGIPVVLVNARLSKKSLKGYLKLPKTTKEMITTLDLVLAQYKPDKKRLIRLGCNEQKIKAIGNIKFDLSLPTEQIADAEKIKKGLARPIWVAASTHDKEEKIIFATHKQLLKTQPNLLLIVVPRHKERFKEVALLASEQFAIQHRSTLSGVNSEVVRSQNSLNVKNEHFVPIHSQTQVLIGDTIGEMFWYLTLADICFIGGSLVKTGGHNPIEPAAVGLPIITGPYTFNFKTVFKQCQKKKFCIQLDSQKELLSTMQMLFNDPIKRAGMAKKAKRFVSQNQGVTDQMIAELTPLIAKEHNHESRPTVTKTLITN
ncbi:3-deoxy-D-manno-octulosonic acid transferase [Psychrosphaera sp. 1_MG-2023]|uniref:3-deoxy-D-manno-octulosonic acid transferase n=1 Tax=Psychrosphaera sp. 1_MG-2023 TaxID=3062643 RepID=UPI0026E217EB|nr:3-deoxy-D-manno-octulosonic acid transferase [Psychrosphaera sp. 1_MG-2023]MDO6719342.1 3-deoxy-D-manno-octulosonic acid transferase [Psychrosphaera sp. 1_MG-2023]